MKQESRVSKSLMLIFLVSVIALSGCEKEKVDPGKYTTELLVGDWQMIEKDGASYPAPNTSFILTFESSGDAKTCYQGDDNPLNNGCDSANWRWEDNTQSNIIVSFGADEVKFDLVLLDETKLEYTITYEPNTTSYKYIRVP